MIPILLAQWAMPAGAYWHILPLVALVSIVYSATRHEAWGAIWHRAMRLAFVILVFLAIMTVLLWAIHLL